MKWLFLALGLTALVVKHIEFAPIKDTPELLLQQAMFCLCTFCIMHKIDRSKR